MILGLDMSAFDGGVGPLNLEELAWFFFSGFISGMGADGFTGVGGADGVGVEGIAVGRLWGVGGFTNIDALERGESTVMKDDGDEAMVARAEAEMAEKGLGSEVGKGTAGAGAGAGARPLT